MRNALARVLFWTYPRGSWQYDVFCVCIILFIVLTPAWVFERPGNAGAARSAEERLAPPPAREGTWQAGPAADAPEEEPDLPQLTRSDTP